MSEADEMYEGIESVIMDMIKEYENKKTYTDLEEENRQGAIGALEELLERLNE